MISWIIVNSGLEELALKEVFELIGVKGKVSNGVVEFEAEKKDLVKLSSRGQSFRKILIGLGKVSSLGKVDFSKINWKDYFSKGVSFKVEVEGVLGNEKRLKIGKQVGSKVFLSVKKKLGFELKFDMKKPDVMVLVYYSRKNYFIGIDVCGNLDKRSYRVFVNSASFKGDLAYYFVRKSGFVSGEKLVVGFVKDGTIAIEAGLFVKKKGVFGFDSSMVSIIAAKKNAKIAKVSELIELSKFDLDEMDVKFSKGSVNRLIFQVTKKDEDKLNEIYYQTDYVLKKKVTLLMVGRKDWDISVSDKFKLVSSEEIKRGGSIYKVWLMEKK